MSDSSAFRAGAASGFTVRLLTQPLDVLKIRFQLQKEPISTSFNQSYYRGIYHAVNRIITEEGIYGLWKGHVPAQYLSIVFGAVQFQTFDTLYKRTNTARNSVNDLLFGGLSGLSASLLCHPIDVIRTRLSSQGPHKIYTGLSNAILCILTEEGLLGYFRGLVPSMILVFPQTAIQFYIYHGMRRFLSPMGTETVSTGHDVPKQTILSSMAEQHLSLLLCGSVAGVVAKSSVYPLELAKRRLQVQGFEEARRHFGELHKSRTMLHCLWKTALDEGVSGLYKGLVPSSLKAAIVSSLTFYFFEMFKKVF